MGRQWMVHMLVMFFNSEYCGSLPVMVMESTNKLWIIIT